MVGLTTEPEPAYNMHPELYIEEDTVLRRKEVNYLCAIMRGLHRIAVLFVLELVTWVT